MTTPTPHSRYHNGSARRKTKQRHIAAAGPTPTCALCGKPIDLTLKTPHPMSCELDEIIPFSLGGSATAYDNTQLVHRICNQRKSNKLVYGLQGQQPNKKTDTMTNPLSRQW